MQPINRRDFLKLASLAGVAVVAAACAPAAPVAPQATDAPQATEAPQASWQGDIEFYAQLYTPTSAMPNPDPDAAKREAMAILAEEWQDLHPGVNLIFFQAPAEVTYTEWINTQLIGGTGPDIFWLWLGSLGSFADEGKTIPLNDYLQLPNKYMPEDTTPWGQHFKSPFQTSFSTKGQWGGVPLDLVSTGVFCNKDMFKSVGIDLDTEILPEIGSPKDWATLLRWCQTFVDAGYYAFFVSLNDPGGWLPRVLMGQLFWRFTDAFDVLNYHPNTPQEHQQGIISQEEVIMQYACNGWKPFEEEATRTYFELMKQLASYFPPGTATMTDSSDGAQPASASDLFMQNQLAMLWDGSWQLGPFLQDDRRKFEFSSFWMPPITKETSELAHDPVILPIGVGGYGSIAYGINRKCLAKGNVDTCVDWLMYITTPEHDEMIVNEVPSMVPAHKKAKSLPEVESMFVGETRLVGGGRRPWNPLAWWFGYADNKYGDTLKRETDLYLLDEQDLDQFMANMEAAAQEDLPNTLRSAAIQYSEDGSWDLTQWPCQPAL